MKQYVYNDDNVSKNYWGCYTIVNLKNDSLVLINTLNNYKLTLKGDCDDLKSLCIALDNGVEDDKLVRLLSKLKCEKALEDLLFMGMIE